LLAVRDLTRDPYHEDNSKSKDPFTLPGIDLNDLPCPPRRFGRRNTAESRQLNTTVTILSHFPIEKKGVSGIALNLKPNGFDREIQWRRNATRGKLIDPTAI